MGKHDIAILNNPKVNIILINSATQHDTDMNNNLIEHKHDTDILNNI